jgi:hypothetical protein
MIKVEKNVPLAPDARGKAMYPWHEMEVGDSFFVPGKTAVQMSSSARNVSLRLGKKFSCRTTPEGVRVWRTG